MCGIIYVKRKEHCIVKPMLKRYEHQKSRGSEGFGFVAVQDNQMIERTRDESFEGISKSLMSLDNGVNEIMFHHRYPTSTDNIAEQAHPICVDNPKLRNKYYVVHNGVLHNYDDKKKSHNDMGFIYETEATKQTVYRFADNSEMLYSYEKTNYNDSEVFAIEFALWNEGINDSIDVVGSVAFVALEVDKETGNIIALHFGRNDGNPLKIWSDISLEKDVIDDKEKAMSILKGMIESNLFTISSESDMPNAISIDDNKVYSYYHQLGEVNIRDIAVGKEFYMGYTQRSHDSTSMYKNYGLSGWSMGDDLDDLDSDPVDMYDIDDSKYGELFPYKNNLALSSPVLVEPLCDKKQYEQMTTQELRWEELALEDKIDALGDELQSYEEMLESDSIKRFGYIRSNNTTYTDEDLISLGCVVSDKVRFLDGYLDVCRSEMLMSADRLPVPHETDAGVF